LTRQWKEVFKRFKSVPKEWVEWLVRGVEVDNKCYALITSDELRK
jgi:hypothetical protein